MKEDNFVSPWEWPIVDFRWKKPKRITHSSAIINLLRNALLHRSLFVTFEEFIRTPFWKNTSRWFLRSFSSLATQSIMINDFDEHTVWAILLEELAQTSNCSICGGNIVFWFLAFQSDLNFLRLSKAG